LHAASPKAHPPLDESGSAAEDKECQCTWCQEFADMKDEAQQAAPFLDLAPTSLIATMLYDLDVFPDIHSTPPLDRATSSPSLSSSSRLPLPSLPSSPTRHGLPPLPLPGSSRTSVASFSSLLNAFNNAAALFQQDVSGMGAAEHNERRERLRRGLEALSQATATTEAARETRRDVESQGTSSSETSGASSSTSSEQSASSTSAVTTIIPAAPAGWRSRVSLCDRLLPSASLRSRLFNLLLNGTAATNLHRPEIAFRRGGEEVVSASITKTKHVYRNMPHTHLIEATGDGDKEKEKNKKDLSVDEMTRENMFQQLCDSFIKSNLYSKPLPLRSELGAVTFKCILSGVLDQGAAGLPGPFRQALAEISAFLNSEATESGDRSSPMPFFIPSPNSRSQTGDDRHKLLLNPALLQQGEISLVKARIFGQLLAIAVRSKCCLNLDIASVFWRQLLCQPLNASDLATFDFTAAQSLQFIDPTTNEPFTKEEFDEYLGYLTWTTVLSDGVTQVELKPAGSNIRVTFEQRYEYAQRAIEARLQESALLVAAIRDGMLSVIPKQSFHYLSWRELELRVCGRPTIDLAVLERHTVYNPAHYNRHSPVVQWFWQILSEFSEEERGQWLQFSWARSRLPAEEGGQGSYRMQLNIIDHAPRGSSSSQQDGGGGPNDLLLPTSETCFFNVNMPRYSNIETMRAKMRMALLCSTITS